MLHVNDQIGRLLRDLVPAGRVSGVLDEACKRGEVSSTRQTPAAPRPSPQLADGPVHARTRVARQDEGSCWVVDALVGSRCGAARWSWSEVTQGGPSSARSLSPNRQHRTPSSSGRSLAFASLDELRSLASLPELVLDEITRLRPARHPASSTPHGRPPDLLDLPQRRSSSVQPHSSKHLGRDLRPALHLYTLSNLNGGRNHNRSATPHARAKTPPRARQGRSRRG